MSKKTALDFVANEAWAIRPEWLETICSIAEREHEYAGNIEALEQKLGRPLNNTYAVTMRDGVALLPVTGPLFRHANLMTQLSGATSYSSLATDLRAAVDNPAVRAIVLNIDSPGGEVRGVNELAKQIKAVRGVKPIVAYIGGSGASAAYWLASAADRIVADEVSTIGSIGAMMGVSVRGERPGEKSYSFVSSQSPLKNASPETSEGAAELQRLVNEYAQVFVDTVAANRGVSVDTVLQEYGQGTVFAGNAALSRGMVDSIGTLEGLIAELSGSKTAMGGNFKGAISMTPQELAAKFAAENPEAAAILRTEGQAAAEADNADALAAARAEGAQAERDRIQAVRAQALAGHEELIETLAMDGKTTGEQAAVAILAAEKARVTAAGEARFSKAEPIAQGAAEGDAAAEGEKKQAPAAKELAAKARAKVAEAAAKGQTISYTEAVNAVLADQS